ncbi:MAG: hypothetical protein ACRDQ2_00215 [Gaiellales bacterium]
MQQVSIGELTETLTPRLTRGDVHHARMLAENYERLPPILVHRESMAIIDGVHRLIAGKLLHRDHVPVQFFDGSEFEAFVEAVQANSTHGKPLTTAERTRAVHRILALRPEWSDRKVAEVCGLSARTVGTIRSRVAGACVQLSARVGRDGRRRPTNPGIVRLQVADLLRHNPGASARAIAAQLSTSQATVLDVRRRVDRGESPMPARFEAAIAASNGPTTSLGPASDDAACAATDAGLEFARWFDSTGVTQEQADAYVDTVPLSRIYLVADEARQRSTTWQRFASLVEARTRSTRVG